MRFRLKNGGYIGLPIMSLSLRELWPQVMQQLLALVWQMEVETQVIVGPPKVVELSEVAMQRHPLAHMVHCPHLT
jgi:hypothetical protein